MAQKLGRIPFVRSSVDGGNVQDYDVIVLLNNKIDQSRFYLGRFIVKKDKVSNKVTMVAQRTKIRDNLTYGEAIKFLGQIKSTVEKDGKILPPDIIITSILDFHPNTLYYPIFDIDPQKENDMIIDYMSVSEKKVIFADTLAQQIKNGKGCYLPEEVGRRLFKIDFLDIKMNTLAVMFAMDAIKRYHFRQLMSVITDWSD